MLVYLSLGDPSKLLNGNESGKGERVLVQTFRGTIFLVGGKDRAVAPLRASKPYRVGSESGIS